MRAKIGANLAVYSMFDRFRKLRAALLALAHLFLVALILSGCAIPLRHDDEPSHFWGAGRQRDEQV